MAKRKITRRRFVGGVGTGLAFTIVPRHVLGRGYRAPSDTLNIACIGVGGMGASDVKGVGKTENVYALCDVTTSRRRRPSSPSRRRSASGTSA